jgi:hypothetical protein
LVSPMAFFPQACAHLYLPSYAPHVLRYENGVLWDVIFCSVV